MKKSLLVVATVLLVVVFATVAQASVLFVDGFNRNEDTFPNWAVARSDPEDIKTVTSPYAVGVTPLSLRWKNLTSRLLAT